MNNDAEESSTKTDSSKPPKRTVKRCLLVQKIALVDYMLKHPQLARFECDSATAAIEWQRLVDILNRTGTVKTLKAWKHTWRDLKRKAVLDEEKALASNTTTSAIDEISGKIRELMEDSDDNLIGIPTNFVLSAEESDCDQAFDVVQAQESVDNTVEVQAEDMEPQARASPSSELESLPSNDPVSSSDSSPCSSPTPPTNKCNTRCTKDQLNTLLDCMAINTSMAFGRQDTPKKLGDWKRLRQFLNRMGPARRTMAWQRTWRDLQRKVINTDKSQAKMIPTYKKVLDIVESYKEKCKHERKEISADESHMFMPPEATDHREHSKSPLSEYLILPEVDRSKIRGTGKQSKILPTRGSAYLTSPGTIQNENEQDSDADSELSQKSRETNNVRITSIQKYAIAKYISLHPGLAASWPTDRHSYAKWQRLTKYLNKHGPAKTTNSWIQTWQELNQNARSNRSSNGKWSKIKRITNICDNASTLKPQARSSIKNAQGNDRPNNDSPLTLRRQSSHTEPHSQPDTPPEVVLCEEGGFDDIRDPSLDRMSHSKRSSDGSPERLHSMSPRQRSERSSPVRIKKKLPQQSLQPKSKNIRCTPHQINALMNYMAKHPNLGKAKFLYAVEERDPWHDEWRRLTRYLNSLHKMGPARSIAGWKTTWRSLCRNAQRKKSNQCSSYESVYKRVLKILNDGHPNDNTKQYEKRKVLKSVPTKPPLPPDPLKFEQAPKYTTSQALHSRHVSPGRHRSDRLSHEQRGSRMSPIRVCVNVAPVRRGSDRISPVRTRDLTVHPAKENQAYRLNFNSELNSSRKVMRSSNRQLRAMADYMIAHPKMAIDNYSEHRDAWFNLAKVLNEIGPVRKPTGAWQRTWRDIKRAVRAREHTNLRSRSLEGFREEKILKLMNMSPEDLENAVESDYDNMHEELKVPERKVTLTPRASSPPTKYNLAKILARSSPRNDRPAETETVRNDNVPSKDETCSPTATNKLLQTLIQEVRRSNELHVEQSGYLKEILKQLRTQQSTPATRNGDRDSTVNNSSAHEQNDEILENTIEIQIQEENSASHHCIEVDDSDNETPVTPSPAIRPVSLLSLTGTQKPNERMIVQSTLQGKVKPVTPKGKLIKLKDGTMMLVPDNLKMQAVSNDKNGERMYIVRNVQQNQKRDVTEDLFSNEEFNEYLQ